MSNAKDEIRAVLAALTPEEARRVIADVCATATETDGSTRVEVPPQLPYAIHRLTAGSPLGAGVLGQAVRQNRPVGAVSPGELLTAGIEPEGAAEHDPRPVYRELLDRLVPPGLAEELAVLATAHDGDSARALAEARLGDSFGAAGVNRLRTQLTAEGLPPAEGYFVGDPFLRTLLLLRLHLDDADHGRWRSCDSIAHRSVSRTWPRWVAIAASQASGSCAAIAATIASCSRSDCSGRPGRRMVPYWNRMLCDLRVMSILVATSLPEIFQIRRCSCGLSCM